MLGKFKCITIKFFFCFRFQRRSRRHFYHLLKSSLHTTVTLKKMNNISVIITEDLHFNMLWVVNIFFYKNSIITKSISSFSFRFMKSFFKCLFFINYPHSPAAAACTCFKNNRETNPSCFL